MVAYLRAFVNFEQKNRAKLLPMAYNNANTGTSLFELHCKFNSRVLFEENVNTKSKFKFTKALQQEVKDLPADCRRNLQKAQELQTKAHVKGLRSMTTQIQITSDRNVQHIAAIARLDVLSEVDAYLVAALGSTRISTVRF